MALLPQLVEKLSDSSLQNLVVNALLTYDSTTVLALAKPALKITVSNIAAANTGALSAELQRSAIALGGWVQWMSKCVDIETRDECISLVLYLTRTAAEILSALKEEDSQYLRRRARVMETLEPLIDYLLRVSPEPSTLATVRNRFSSILMSTSEVDVLILATAQLQMSFRNSVLKGL